MSHPLQQGWGRHRAPRALPRARRSQGLPKLRLQRKGVSHGRGNEDALREKEKILAQQNWDVPCSCTNSPEPLQDPAGRFLLSPPGRAKRRAGEHDPGEKDGEGEVPAQPGQGCKGQGQTPSPSPPSLLSHQLVRGHPRSPGREQQGWMRHKESIRSQNTAAVPHRSISVVWGMETLMSALAPGENKIIRIK